MNISRLLTHARDRSVPHLGRGESLRVLARGRALLAVGLFVGVVAAAGLGLEHSQASARSLVGNRFRAKVAAGSDLVSTYVSQLVGQEKAAAARNLAGPHPSAAAMGLASLELGSPAAVLLDGRGNLIQAYPADPGLVGANLTNRYAHLRTALGGQIGVSNQVLSAVDHVPIVAVAVPVKLAGGPGVFSAGFDVHDSPLDAYLGSAFPKPTTGVFLLDSRDSVVAQASGPEIGPAIAAAHNRTSGTYAAGSRTMFFASAPVAGTPWRIEAIIPLASLQAPVHDQWIGWVLLAGFGAAGAIALFLLGRLLAGRNRIAVALENSRALDAIKADFVSSVSHDLRTPLTSIVGYTELMSTLGEGDLTADQKAMLAGIGHSAARLGLLIDDLLTVSQIQAGQFRLASSLVYIDEVVNDVATIARPLAAQAGVELNIDLLSSGLSVLADRSQLERAVLNLTGNAIKFTPPGGRVDLRVTAADGQAAVVVADTGMGIPAAEVEQIFDRFYRARDARSRHIPGTGLGLAIAKSIVELHGGQITVASQVGAGTQIAVLLSIAAAAPTHVPSGLVLASEPS